MATCPPGSVLLLARNCHLSAFSAAVLAGCGVAWVAPEEDAAHGVAHCVAPGGLAAALAEQQAAGARVGAVMVVSPTYFGVTARVEGERRGASLELIPRDLGPTAATSVTAGTDGVTGAAEGGGGGGGGRELPHRPTCRELPHRPTWAAPHPVRLHA